MGSCSKVYAIAKLAGRESLLHPSNSELIAKVEQPLIRKETGSLQKYPTGYFLPPYRESADPNASVFKWRRLDGGDFLEQAVLYSLLHARSITEQHPGVWLTKSSGIGFASWHSKKKSRLRNTSRTSIVFVLEYGSYEQCRFVMERLVPLRSKSGLGAIVDTDQKNGTSNHQEEGILPWTRCPLLPHEFGSLLLGNIKRSQGNRQELWNVVEEQVKMGHSKSGYWLKQAILRGNTDAVEQMLRRGWTANGPIWTRYDTPLQYSKGLKDSITDFEYLFRQMNPDLPQNEWIGSATHAVTYKAYQDQIKEHSWTQWRRRLVVCQEILENNGGKIFWVGKTLQSENHAILQLWSFIFIFCLHTVVFPPALVYGTTNVWTTMNTKEKFGFAYLWSLLSICLLRVFRHWANTFPFAAWRSRTLLLWRMWLPILLMFFANYFALPILVIRVNWQPLLSCRTTMSACTEAGACQTAQTCTNHSYLLPLVAGGIEFILWSTWQETRSWLFTFFDYRSAFW